MAAPKLSTQDKKDLDKFAKYLVYKCIQIIVQSRLGEKIHTHSKTFSSGSDWFNLGIGDIPEVKAETVKIFNGNLSLGQNVCVEISLKTAEGETMILETWWLTLTEQCDPGARVSYTVYNRMGTLLKSLFSISRSTPSYRLSRKQGPETFVICYRLYMGEPQMSHLGEGFSKSKVGGVPTPVGTFSLSVAYRTKMLISPHTSTKDLCEDLQENHFNNEASPKKVNESRPCIITRRERKFSGDDHGLMFGDPQDICATTFTNSPSDPRIYTTAYGTTPPTIQRKLSADQGSSVDDNNKENIPRPDNAPYPSNGPRVCAFAPHLTLGHGCQNEDEEEAEEDEEDIPFGSLLRARCPHSPGGGSTGGGRYSSGSSQDERMSDTITQSAGSSSTNNTRSTQSAHSHGSQSAPDDFVMVELKTPFAGPEGNSDLGRFYHDFQGAPALTMFKNSVTVEDTLNSITDQLSVFDAKSRDFDDFIKNLQTSEG